MWRSEHEMLALVEGEAAGRRRRRQIVGLGSGLTLILLISFIAVGLRSSGGDPNGQLNVASAGAIRSGPTTTVTAVPGIATPPAAPTTTTVVGPLPIASIVPPATTPGTTIPATEEVPPATTPHAGGASDAPATTAPTGLCARRDVVYSVTTDKASYLPGEQVKSTATFLYVGAAPCHAPAAQLTTWEDGTGKQLMGMGSHYDCFEPTPCGPVLTNGQSHTIVQCWDQVDQNGQVAPGAYAVTQTLDDYSARASFQIEPDPSGTTTTLPTGTFRPCS